MGPSLSKTHANAVVLNVGDTQASPTVAGRDELVGLSVLRAGH